MPLRVSAPGPRRAGVVLIPLFVLLAAGLTTAGFFSYRSYERHFRAEVEHQLAAVAELKVSDLARWRRERLGDGSVFCGNPAFSGLVRRWFEAPDDVATQARIRAWLGNVQAAYQYDRVILLDARGVPRMSVPDRPEPAAAPVPQDALEVLRSGRATFRDFHRDAPDGPIHLAVLAPILDPEDSRSLGVVVLRIDPERYLYPLLQRWPIASRTAETLLVRRDGNDVLFLNELRFQKGTALTLRKPLIDTNLPAVKAVLGQEGVDEGVDYRGVPVVAAVRVVPDSPWSLVARMDATEVYAPLRERLWMLVALVGLTLLATGAGFGFVWRQQELQAARERYRAAEALSSSEARFRLVAESAPVGMAQADPRTGRWLSVNPKMCAMTGYSEREMLGLRVSDITHPEDRAADWEAFQRVVRGEAPSYKIEKRYLRKDGSEAWVSVNMTVLRDAAGAPLRTLATIEEITERKRAAVEHETIIRTTQDGFWVNDVDGRFLDVNDSLCRMLGRTREELLRLGVTDIEASETPEETVAHIRRVREAGHDRFETRHRRKDGTSIDVEISVTHEAGLNGRMFVFSRDVTQRRRTEQDLRLKDIVFESSLASGSIADGDGIIRHVNPAFLRLWGYESTEAACGQPIAAFFADARDAAPVLAALQETGSWEGEFLARRRDGSTFLSKGLATIVRDAGGALIGYQSTNLDVSVLRDAEERFRLAAESSNDVIYEWDLRQDVRWLGDVDVLTGHLPGGFPRTLDGWIEVLHPEDRERVMAAVQAHLSERAPYAVEYRVRARDGSYRWWSARGVVARLADGTPTRWIGTITDVTERQREGEALRASEHFLDRVFEQSPHAMWISDSRGTLIRLNQACRDLLQVTDAEVVGKYNVLEDNIVGSRDISSSSGASSSTVRPPASRSSTTAPGSTSSWAGTSRVVLDVTMSAVLGSDGRVAHAIVQHVDITDRVRAEETVALQKRIAEIFLAVPDDGMFYEVLKVVLEVMDSRFGVFGYLDEAGDLVVPTMTRDVWDKCQVPEKSITFPRDTWGDSSWPRAIRERTPNYSNEVSTKTPRGPCQPSEACLSTHSAAG